MNLVKCPRCDLNYIREDEKYCKVCLQEMKESNSTEETEPETETENVDTTTIGDMDAVSGMDEIIPEVEEEETDEFEEIDQEMSLEDVREEEEKDADADEEEDDF